MLCVCYFWSDFCLRYQWGCGLVSARRYILHLGWLGVWLLCSLLRLRSLNWCFGMLVLRLLLRPLIFVLKFSFVKCDWRICYVFVVCRPFGLVATLGMWESLDRLESIVEVAHILWCNRQLGQWSFCLPSSGGRRSWFKSNIIFLFRILCVQFFWLALPLPLKLFLFSNFSLCNHSPAFNK